jgi:hypothetical protein
MARNSGVEGKELFVVSATRVKTFTIVSKGYRGSVTPQSWWNLLGFVLRKLANVKKVPDALVHGLQPSLKLRRGRRPRRNELRRFSVSAMEKP